MTTTKTDLRRLVREQKARFSPPQLAAWSAVVLAQIESLPEFRQARTVAAYWPLADEVDTRALIGKWCAEKRILLPAMCGRELELRQYLAGCRMVAADFGISEPQGPPFPPGQVDLALVPGMAFDRQGRRLGRGKGFYDRLLARMPALKVGLCFDFQLFDHIPVEPHDVPVQIVLSGGPSQIQAGRACDLCDV